MKKLSLILIAILATGVLKAHFSGDKLHEQSILRTVKNNAFQAGEKLTYILHYGALNAGRAKLEVKTSAKTIKNRPLLHIVGTGHTISAFEWFYKVNDRYESYIDQKGLFPWVFIRRVNEGGFIINQDYTFYQHKNKVNNGKNEVTVPSHIQDVLSAFYYARTLDFRNAKVGDEFIVKTYLDEEIFPLKVKFLGRETIKIRKGKFKALKFAPVVKEGRIWEKDGDLTIWISDDENKIPLLGRTKILIGSIKVELESYQGLKNPVAKL